MSLPPSPRPGSQIPPTSAKSSQCAPRERGDPARKGRVGEGLRLNPGPHCLRQTGPDQGPRFVFRLILRCHTVADIETVQLVVPVGAGERSISADGLVLSCTKIATFAAALTTPATLPRLP